MCKSQSVISHLHVCMCVRPDARIRREQESVLVTKKPVMDLGKDNYDVAGFLGRSPKHLRGSRKVDVVKASQKRSRFAFGPSAAQSMDATTKAFSACFSIVFKHLTADHRETLMANSYRVSPRAGDELILEGSEIEWLFVVVSGVYQVLSTTFEREMLLGNVRGSGQVLGERDFLMRQHMQSLVSRDCAGFRHSVTVVADDDCSVIAIPVGKLEECLAQTSFAEDIESLLDARAVIHEVISGGPTSQGQNRAQAPLTSLLNETELHFVVDCAGIAMYEDGESLHDRPELAECVTAIVIEGELEIEQHHVACPSQSRTSDMEPEMQEQKAHGESHKNKRLVLAGDELYDVVKACQRIRNGTLVDTYSVLAVETTKILFIRIEDIIPILTTNYALRKLIKDELQDVTIQLPYHLYFFPWMRNLEWRVANLGMARRVGQASWNDVEDAEAQVYWNRIAEHMPQDDWHPILSDFHVTVTFCTNSEAMTAVQVLDKKWAGRFARVQIAGAHCGYTVLVQSINDRIRECGASEPSLGSIRDELAVQGIRFDRDVWRTLLRGFNSCRPLPIDSALPLLEDLAAQDGLETEFLQETVDEWCKAGLTRSAAKFLDGYQSSIKGGEISAKLYLSTVNGWIRERDPQMALASISCMWATGAVPDIDLMHSVIALLIYLQRIAEAEQVLQEMEACAEDEGPCPTKQTYLLVISGLTTIAEGDKIESCIKRMQQRLGVAHDTTSLNFLVEAHCISGAVESARRIVETMHTKWGCEPDEATYSILGSGLVMDGMPEEAAKLLVHVGSRGYDSNKVDLHQIVLSWRERKWRQAEGFEVQLPCLDLAGGKNATGRDRHSLQMPSREQQHDKMTRRDRSQVNKTSIGTYNKTSAEELPSVGAIQSAVASELSDARRDFFESQLNASRYVLFMLLVSVRRASSLSAFPCACSSPGRDYFASAKARANSGARTASARSSLAQGARTCKTGAPSPSKSFECATH